MRGEKARAVVQTFGSKKASQLVAMLVVGGMSSGDAQRDIHNALDKGWLVLGDSLELKLP